MKLILTTLNSKFVHSCLSIRYLKGYSENIINTELREYTINQNIDYIVSEIYKERPDIVGFSTYIWNLRETLEICETLKIINPDMTIFLGGPEVSFDGAKLMRENKFIDFIIYGEGELTFKEFIENFIEGTQDYSEIEGLIYRRGEDVIMNPPRPLIEDLNQIPSPYDENVKEELENRIIYYESSRGCPFGCKFCLSSTIKGVRYFDLERVKKELGILIDANVRQVKFVDRTFNANKKYAMEIMNFIMERNPKNINFHFEVTAHLLDEEMLEFLRNVPEGMFQFEVGVQSTNDKVIKAVGRTTDFPKLREVTKRIKSYKKIHQHLDLIAGLPYEDYESFKKSFNDVYEIRPEKVQLGFLKLLKGSELRREEEKYGFKYLDVAPYEVLETDYISYSEIRMLKLIDDIVDRFYNGEIFKHSMEYIVLNEFESPFDFFEDFAKYWEEKNYHQVSHSKGKLYDILKNYYLDRGLKNPELFNEVIKLDFIENNKGQRLPKAIRSFKIDLPREVLHEVLKSEELLSGSLKDYAKLPTKEVLKDIRIEKFSYNILDIVAGKEAIREENYILTLYKDGVINRFESIKINKIIEELI